MAGDFMPRFEAALQKLADDGHDEAAIREAAPQILAEIKKLQGQPGPYAEGMARPGPYRDGPQARIPQSSRILDTTQPERQPVSKSETFIRGAIEGVVPGAHALAGANELDTRPAHTRANPFMPMVQKPAAQARAGASAEGGRLDQAIEDNPMTGVGGMVAGSLLSAPGVLAAKAGTGVTKALMPHATTLATKGGALAAGGAAGAGVASVGADAMRGTAPGEMGENALQSLRDGLMMTAPIAAAGAASGGVQRALRSNKTIGRYALARESGALKDPKMRALEEGDPGIHQAADGGLQRIMARDEALESAAQGRYGAAVEPHLLAPVDRNAVRRELLAARVANKDPDSGIPLRQGVEQRLTRVIDETPEAPTVEGTLARRRALRQEAGFGSPSPSPEQEATREAYGALRKGVREASPEVAAADDAYAAHRTQAARRRDILKLSDDADMTPATVGDDVVDAPAPGGLDVGESQRATDVLKRVGDENAPGLRVAKYLDELAGQDPEFAAALDFIANKKAQELVRFRASGLNTGKSLSSATEVALNFGKQNARAIGAQVVEPAAGAISRAAAPVSTRMAPLEAARAEGERRRTKRKAQQR